MPQNDLEHILPGIDDLWAETLGDSQVCVAILDGPVDLSHPSLQKGDLTRVPTLMPDQAGRGRMSLHGTHIASVIFGQDDGPVKGIAPQCRGLVLTVFSDNQKGPLSQLDLARAINQAVDAGAQIINVSGGQLSQTPEADQMLANAIKYCDDSNVLIVAAAGNDGCQCLHVPAALPSVLAVGAADAQGRPLQSSNWGEVYFSQGVLAPGSDIFGAAPGGSTVSLSGTSFATPIVSGVAALLLSLQVKRGEKPNPKAVRKAILASANPCDPKLVGDCSRFLVGSLNIPGTIAIINGDSSATMTHPESPASPLQPTPQVSEPDFSQVQASADVTESAPPIRVTEPPVAVNASPIAATTSAAAVEIPRNTTTQPPAHGLTPAMTATPGVALESASPVEPSDQSEQLKGDSVTHSSSPLTASTAVTPSNIQPAEDCGCNSGPKPLVYALGTLDYDFGTEARRDSFRQLMEAPENPFPSPHNPNQMVDYLTTADADSGITNLDEALHLIWTLNIELTPVYAIKPNGPFAEQFYTELVSTLREQITPVATTSNGEATSVVEAFEVERVSIPGYLTGETVTLFSGQVVPVLVPQRRGFYSWKTAELINVALDAAGSEEGLTNEEQNRIRNDIEDFLHRIYFDLRNLGQTPQERALNYAATNAFSSAIIFGQTVRRGMQLDDIGVERSPFCRMDSDCWDVRMTFFDPENNRRARRVFRYTVDVSDVMPVTVGDIRSWAHS